MGAWRRWGRRLALAAAVALVTGATAIAYVSHREQDNRFCVSCHLPGGKRLHGELYARYEANPGPPSDLSALHKEKKEVKCIDCHGGVGLVGRSRVILLAARDALMYVSGRFKEPDRMTTPLWDRDCVRCHADYNVGPWPEEGQAGGRDFHKHPDHRALSMTCVECHTSHVAGDPRIRFLNNAIVLPLCRRCHKEMGREAQNSVGGERRADEGRAGRDRAERPGVRRQGPLLSSNFRSCPRRPRRLARRRPAV